MCDKDAISHVERGKTPLLGVYPFSICALGSGPLHNMQTVLPRGTTWHSPLTVYTAQYHTQRTVTAHNDYDVHERQKKMETIKTDLYIWQPDWLYIELAMPHWSDGWPWRAGEGQREEDMKLTLVTEKSGGGWRWLIGIHFVVGNDWLVNYCVYFTLWWINVSQ